MSIGGIIMEIILIPLIIVLYLYRILGRPVICDKKITKHINDMGGKVKNRTVAYRRGYIHCLL